MNQVELSFKDKALVKGGVMLFSKENAIQFIRACEKENLKILGVDSFLMFGEKIQPSLENSIDFSTEGIGATVFDQAAAFVKSKDDKFLFEIVCE